MVPEKKHKKSKSKEKEKKKRQDKKNYSSISEDELFEDESETDDDAAINMEEDLHPIGYYVDDRKTMLDHVFSVTTERKIRAMLPPVLKGLPLLELKAMCLDQLLGMSAKRILSVLEGQQLDSSSDTDDAGNDSDSEPKGREGDEKNQGDGIEDIDGFELSAPDLDTLEIGITSKEIGDLFTDDAEPKTEKNKEKAIEKKPKHVPKKKHKKRSEKEKKKRDKDSKTEAGKVNKPAQLKENTEEEKGKSLLEILELEMRARAIRALLREHGDSPARDPHSPAVQLPCQRQAGGIKREDRSPDKEEVEVRCPRKARRLKSRFQPSVVKNEVIDVDTDSSSGDAKEVVTGIHSDLETVSSGEEVFMDMKKTYDAAREDGEISSPDDDVIEAKRDVQTDVVVVDDTDGEDRGHPLSEVAAGDSAEPSWAQRWLKSKGVQRVVTDSKMFARIHKRLRTARRGQGACPVERQRVDAPPSVEVVGSVDEYKSLQLK